MKDRYNSQQAEYITETGRNKNFESEAQMAEKAGTSNKNDDAAHLQYDVLSGDDIRANTMDIDYKAILCIILNIGVLTVNAYAGIVLCILLAFYEKRHLLYMLIFIPMFEAYCGMLWIFTVTTFIYAIFLVYFVIFEGVRKFDFKKIMPLVVFLLFFVFSNLVNLLNPDIMSQDVFYLAIIIIKLLAALMIALIFSDYSRIKLTVFFNTVAAAAVPLLILTGVLFFNHAYVKNPGQKIEVTGLSMLNDNAYSIMITVLAVLCLYIFITNKSILFKVSSGIAIVIAAVVMSMMVSRSAYLTLAVFMVFSFIYYTKSIYSSVFLIMAGIVFTIVYALLNPDLITKLSIAFITSEFEVSFEYLKTLSPQRYKMLTAIPGELTESPLRFFLGWGWFNSIEFRNNIAYGGIDNIHHNVILAMLSRTGIIGLSAFAYIVYDIWKHLYYASKAESLSMIMFFVVLFGAMFNPLFTSELFWILAGIGMGTSAVLKGYKNDGY